MRGRLDMDGVIANCTGAIAKRFGIEHPKDLIMENPRKTYEEDFGYDKVMKIFEEESFWVDMPKYSWSDKIISFFEEKFGDDWIFLTKGFDHSASFSGKFKWIKKHYPQHLDKLWVCRGEKYHACGGEGDFLLDDTDYNLYPWVKAGGIAYKWTEMTEITNDRIVNERIEGMDKLLSAGFTTQ